MSLFDSSVKIDWPAIWDAVGETNCLPRIECDDCEGWLSVGPSCDGDFHLKVWPGRHQKGMSPSFRSRTFQGGGHNHKVRTALALLTLAIIEDSKSAKGAAE